MPKAPPQVNAKAYQENRKRYDRSRKVDHDFYNSTEWKRFRKWFLSTHPTCEWCRKRGKIKPATQVDHRRPRVELPEDRWCEESECRAACASCHAKYGAKRGKAEKKVRT